MNAANRLLSTAHGRIRRVLVAMPYWVRRYGHQPEIAPFLDVYAALLTTLPEEAERIVVTHHEAVDATRAWVAELGVADRTRVVGVDDDLDFTVWAQDAFLVRTCEGAASHVLVTPASFERHRDADILRVVAAEVGAPVVEAPLRFQGGNVLVGDDFWLVGADALHHTVADGHARDPAGAAATFAGVLEATRTLHVVGVDSVLPAAATRPMAAPGRAAGSPWEEQIRSGTQAASLQPVFDLDTFVALAGRADDGAYRLLVGDPRLAASLLGRALPDHAAADAFDEVAERLVACGFRVVRNPLPLVHDDDPVLRKRRWYFATSNNVITEIEGGHRRVWLPTYGDDVHPELAETDRRNADIWRDLGFEVVPLPSFHVFARGLGAAHCICKCLAR